MIWRDCWYDTDDDDDDKDDDVDDGDVDDGDYDDDDVDDNGGSLWFSLTMEVL